MLANWGGITLFRMLLLSTQKMWAFPRNNEQRNEKVTLIDGRRGNHRKQVNREGENWTL